MNENETIANLNPKLGKVLARLIRTQECFPVGEKGEPDHGGKPPIGMMPIDEARGDESSVLEADVEIDTVKQTYSV